MFFFVGFFGLGRGGRAERYWRLGWLLISEGLVLTSVWVIVFEGAGHPYKQNLIRFDGEIREVDPEVKTEKLRKNSI